MIVKNNSKHEWLKYNCGGGFVVDVTAGCVLDLPESAAQTLLKNLGHSKWLVKVDVLSEEDKKKVKKYSDLVNPEKKSSKKSDDKTSVSKKKSNKK